MTAHTVETFFTALKADPTMIDAASKAAGRPLPELMQMNPDQLLAAAGDPLTKLAAFATSKGYAVTKDEFLALAKTAAAAKAPGELTDQQLESAAGGGYGAELGTAVGGALNPTGLPVIGSGVQEGGQALSSDVSQGGAGAVVENTGAALVGIFSGW